MRDLEVVRTAKAADLGGRVSGSLEWRANRAELGVPERADGGGGGGIPVATPVPRAQDLGDAAEWRAVGSAGDSADVAAATCVGDLVLALREDGGLVWRRAAGGVAWRATTVARVSGDPWPVLGVTCLAAGADAKLFAVDSAGVLCAVERASAGPGAGGAAWSARVIGVLERGVLAIAVVLGHLAVLAPGAGGDNVLSFSVVPIADVVAAAMSTGTGEAAGHVALCGSTEAHNVRSLGPHVTHD